MAGGRGKPGSHRRGQVGKERRKPPVIWIRDGQAVHVAGFVGHMRTLPRLLPVRECVYNLQKIQEPFLAGSPIKTKTSRAHPLDGYDNTDGRRRRREGEKWNPPRCRGDAGTVRSWRGAVAGIPQKSNPE